MLRYRFDYSYDYREPQILFSIAKSIGLMLQLDKATRLGLYVHYARVLVDYCGRFILGFGLRLDITSFFFAKFYGVVIALEIAKAKG